MRRNIEVDDTLQESVDGAIEQTKDELLGYLKANADTDELPDWGELDYSGVLHEIIDGAVPIYTAEIDAAWFLYSNALEGAYENAGIGDNSRDNGGMVAIYCYIEQQVQEWFAAVLDEWSEQEPGTKFSEWLTDRED